MYPLSHLFKDKHTHLQWWIFKHPTTKEVLFKAKWFAQDVCKDVIIGTGEKKGTFTVATYKSKWAPPEGAPLFKKIPEGLPPWYIHVFVCIKIIHYLIV